MNFKADSQRGPGADDPTVLDLLREGVLDPDLAALVWLLLDARTPLIVAGARRPAERAIEPDRVDRARLLEALLDLVPVAARRIPIDPAGSGLDRLTSADAATAWLTGLDLTAAASPGVRLAFRALSRGAVLAVSMAAESLEEVHARLRAPDLRLTDDELTFLGLVLVVRTVDLADGPSGPRRGDRVVAAHYVRPLARDPAGHVQRLAPAVLAAWDQRADRLDHFAWGIGEDLAGRARLRPGDLEPELARRRDYLEGLVVAGLGGSIELRRALEGYRFANSRHPAG